MSKKLEKIESFYQEHLLKEIERNGLDTNGRSVEIRIARYGTEDTILTLKMEAFIQEKEWGKGTAERMVCETTLHPGYFRDESGFESKTIESFIEEEMGNFVGEIEMNIGNGVRLEREEPTSENTIYDGRHEQTEETERHAPDNKEKPEETIEKPDTKPEFGPEIGEKPETLPDKHDQNDWGDEPEDDTKPGRPHDGQRAGGPDDPGGPNNPPIETPMKPEEKPKPVEQVAFDNDDLDGETSVEAGL